MQANTYAHKNKINRSLKGKGCPIFSAFFRYGYLKVRAMVATRESWLFGCIDYPALFSARCLGLACSHSCKVSLRRMPTSSCFAITNQHSLQSPDNPAQLFKSHVVNMCLLHTRLWTSSFGMVYCSTAESWRKVTVSALISGDAQHRGCNRSLRCPH